MGKLVLGCLADRISTVSFFSYRTVIASIMRQQQSKVAKPDTEKNRQIGKLTERKREIKRGERMAARFLRKKYEDETKHSDNVTHVNRTYFSVLYKPKSCQVVLWFNV